MTDDLDIDRMRMPPVYKFIFITMWVQAIAQVT